MKIHLVYFSATYTTRTVCRGVAEFLGGDVVEHDITNEAPEKKVEIPAEDLLIVGSPVYCGRVPEMEAERLQKFCGNNTRAITLVVYGNRAFDDALIELTRIVEKNGFRTVASAAFIGRHCIFPEVAADRPDNDADRADMKKFAEACRPLVNENPDNLKTITLPGNDEDHYCPHQRVPFCPVPDDSCTNCGTCAKLCPTGAISLKDPHEVNADLCITCGRCVQVCPQHGRHFTGDAYAGAAAGFAKAYGAHLEPEFFYAEKK